MDLSPRLFPPLELPARRAIDLALRPSMIYALAPQKISALNSALGCFWRLMVLAYQKLAWPDFDYFKVTLSGGSAQFVMLFS